MRYDHTSIEKNLKKLDRTIRYMNLMLAKWKIGEELNYEYPEEMWYSRKRLAEKLLSVGLIKCKHEK